MGVLERLRRRLPGLSALPLGTKIAVVVLLLSLASIWLVTIVVTRNLQEHYALILSKQQFSTVSYAAAEIEQKILARFEALEDVAERLAPGLAARAPELRRGLGDSRSLRSLFGNGVVLISAAGEALAWIPESPSVAKLSFDEREFFVEAMKTGKRTIGKARIGRVTGRPNVAFSVPVKAGSGQIIGVLVGFASVSDPTLFGQIEKANLGDTGWTAVDDARYRIIVAISDPGRTPLQPFPAPGVNAMLDRFAAGYEGSGISRNSLGMEVLTSARYIPGTQWFVHAVLPTEEAFAPSRTLTRQAYMLALGISLAVGLAVWLYVSRTLQSLVASSAAIRRMASGAEPFHPLQVKRDDELGEIVASFNALYRQRSRAEAEQQRLQRILRLLGDSNDLLLHADQESELLPGICRLIIDKGGYLLAWVGLLDTAGELRPLAAAANSGPADAAPAAAGPDALARLAIASGRPQVGVEPEGAALPLCGEAGTGLHRSSIGLPLAVGGRAAGALSIYAAEADRFTEEEIGLLEKLAGNLAFGIERIRTQANLAAVNRELQTFTYAASHDMKSPLQRISTFAGMLEKSLEGRLSEHERTLFGFVHENAGRILSLVDDLLGHAQIEHVALQMEPLVLGDVVRAVLQEKKAEFEEAGTEVHCDLAALVVLSSRAALLQVLRNLVDNALKYSIRRTPPTISISAWAEDGRCRLAVRDNGIGFDMAYHERIFEIFRRLHSYSEFAGNGIGLALVKKAMDRMGGKVWAESGVGAGATFFIELPLAANFEATGSEPAALV